MVRNDLAQPDDFRVVVVFTVPMLLQFNVRYIERRLDHLDIGARAGEIQAQSVRHRDHQVGPSYHGRDAHEVLSP